MAAPLDLAVAAATPGKDLPGGSVLRFGDRSVRLPEGEWRVQLSAPYRLDYNDPGSALTQLIEGWGIRLIQTAPGRPRATALLMISTQSGRQFERLVWTDEFCDKPRPRALAHRFNGSYNQPVCSLVQKAGNVAEALGPRLASMLAGNVRDGDYLLNYGNHSGANFLRVVVVIPASLPGGDAQVVALGASLVNALRPVAEYSSRSAQLPGFPD